MGPGQRRLRRAINPISTGLTRWWLARDRRQVPTRPAAPQRRPRVFRGVASPGDWVVPDGLRPGWDWLPEHGAVPNLRAMRRWVRVWFRTPFIDRFAYEWMWGRGGWSVLVPGDSPPPPDSGVRQPRRPRPTLQPDSARLL